MYETSLKTFILLITAFIILAIILVPIVTCTAKNPKKSTPPKQAAEDCFNKGVAAYEKGNYNATISNFTEAISLNPKYVEAYYCRGVAYDNKSLDDEEISNYTEAIKLNPKDADAYNNCGIAYKAKGLYTPAEKDFAKAKELGYKK